MPLGKAKNTPVERLKGLRVEYSKLRGGYRHAVRHLTCETYRVAIKIRKRKGDRRVFLNLVPISGWGRHGKIITEAMTFMMGAKSESQRKTAWKRARAVEFLHKNGVKLNALEEELKNRGGLEAVAREAAQIDPRRKKRPPSEGADPDEQGAGLGEHYLASQKLENDEATGGLARDDPQTNDRLITIVAKIKSSDRSQIEDCEPGTRLALTTVRSKGGGPPIHILAVRTI